MGHVANVKLKLLQRNSHRNRHRHRHRHEHRHRRRRRRRRRHRHRRHRNRHTHRHKKDTYADTDTDTDSAGASFADQLKTHTSRVGVTHLVFRHTHFVSKDTDGMDGRCGVSTSLVSAPLNIVCCSVAVCLYTLRLQVRAPLGHVVHHRVQHTRGASLSATYTWCIDKSVSYLSLSHTHTRPSRVSLCQDCSTLQHTATHCSAL